jgi:hypothetical protein
MRENMAPDDDAAQLGTYVSDKIIVQGRQRTYQKNYSSTAFILDHPIQGNLDSASYALDGGYTGSAVTIIITNDNDVWYENLYANTYVDTTLTTATVNYTTGVITF